MVTDPGPRGERHVPDPQVLDDPAPRRQFAETPPRIRAGHADEVGHGDEERSGIDVAGAGHGIDLEDRPARVGAVDRVAVVDDPLEDRQGPDPHTVRMVDLAEHAKALADAVEAALPSWVVRGVDTIHQAWAGTTPPPVLAEAEAAGRRARADVGPRMRALLFADVDEQRTTPLALLRGAVRYPTEVLAQAGVPPVERDAYAEEMFPDDLYALTPGSLADLGADVHELGLVWGAAKAWEHRHRHGGG